MSSAMPGLLIFDLSYNVFTSIKFADYHGFNGLQKLFLSNNKVLSIEDKALESLSYLRDFHVQNTKLKVIHEDWIRPLKSLRSFFIGNNLIEKFIPYNFSWTSKRPEINIDNNNLAMLPPLPNIMNKNSHYKINVRRNPIVCECKRPGYKTDDLHKSNLFQSITLTCRD